MEVGGGEGDGGARPKVEMEVREEGGRGGRPARREVREEREDDRDGRRG